MSDQNSTRCNHCGAEIRLNANFCHSCGSDESTGWSDLTYIDGIDLPDDDSYEEINENEFGKKAKKSNTWIVITGAILLIITTLILLETIKKI